MIKLLLSLFFTSLLIAKDFSVATYNVENLFDLNYDKSEYQEYIPNSKSKYTKESYEIKLQNISRVINDLNVDIIALQEIESQKAFDDLQKEIKTKYPYSIFKKYESSSVGLAILSREKILDYKLLHVKFSKVNRPILKVDFLIDNQKLSIFNNHWPSKKNGENQRVLYGQRLVEEIKDISNEYIILGDLNSNYNEFETFKSNKLNNTYGYTAINDILKTKDKESLITPLTITKEDLLHYNLWLEKSYEERFSYKFKSQKETPDNIIVPQNMFDKKGIDYIKNSFYVFTPKYLYENGKIKRWSVKNGIHKNKGFSDHLPIIAKFSTTKQEKIVENKATNLKDLYELNHFDKIYKVSNLVLIYKDDEIAILKELNDRAIFVYKNVDNLEFGKQYSLEIKKLKRFNGLLEIIDFQILNYHPYKDDIKKLYLNGQKADILDSNFQNEIVTNLIGTFENGFLNYKFENEIKKIKLYSKDKSLLPKDGKKISIISSHLGFFKNKPQLIIYKQSDFKYVD